MMQTNQSRRRELSSLVARRASKNTGRFLDGSLKRKLQVVLKCDAFGSCEALAPMITGLSFPGVDVQVISFGVGAVSKKDLLMALTGSKLVVGFAVDLMPGLHQWAKEHGVEVRLHNVIYSLLEDLKKIAQSLTAQPEIEERSIGKARVIAIFKTAHKGIIIGCRVLEGSIVLGKEFRIVTAMGPVYTGRIDSLQVERQAVKEAGTGQQVGIKITAFNQASIGDLVECYETAGLKSSGPWRPSGSVVNLYER